MEQRKDESDNAFVLVMPTLEEEFADALTRSREGVPTEEIKRRRELVARTLKLREEIGPINATVDELVREERDGEGEASA